MRKNINSIVISNTNNQPESTEDKVKKYITYFKFLLSSLKKECDDCLKEQGMTEELLRMFILTQSEIIQEYIDYLDN